MINEVIILYFRIINEIKIGNIQFSKTKLTSYRIEYNKLYIFYLIGFSKNILTILPQLYYKLNVKSKRNANII